MKKILFLIISFFMFTSFANASVIVMDMDSNRVLYGKHENEEKLIASTTKIMTAMVVINNSNLNDVVTVTPNVLKSFGSGIYIEVGEKITIEDLLYGLLLRSGNDAALALAEKVGGSEEGFVMLMNSLALSLGMNNTKFINSSGLENNLGEGNISTCYDMALLMSYAMKNEIFKKITSTKTRIVKTNYKTYNWTNKNKLLSMYKYATGGKTGYTKKAKRTLVTSASKNNKNLVIVTLNESDDFDLHKKLYEEYFKKYKRVKIVSKKNFLKEDDLYINHNMYMLLKSDEVKKVKVNVIKTNDVKDRYGYVELILNNKSYFHENIYEVSVQKKSSYFYKLKKFLRELFNF